MKKVVTISPPVVSVTSRGPVAVGVPLVPAIICTVAVALVKPVTWKFCRVTPSPLMTAEVVGPKFVNWPVKLTLKLLTAEPEGSKPLAGLIVRVGVAAHTLTVELTTWPPVAI